MFVTQRLRGGPQPGPGARVGPGQRRRAVPVQHLVHRRGVQPQPKPDPGRPPPAPDPQPQDPPFGAPAQPTRAVLRPARTVRHRVPAVQPVPVGPTLRGGHRHAEPVRRPPQRPPVIDHAPGQPPGRCQGALRWDMRPSRVSVCRRQTAPPHPDVLLMSSRLALSPTPVVRTPGSNPLGVELLACERGAGFCGQVDEGFAADVDDEAFDCAAEERPGRFA